jgi:DNA-directed RNA polymerase subunit RPC12/RpoP
MKPVKLTGRVKVKCGECGWKGTSPKEWGAVVCPRCGMWISFNVKEKAPADPARSTRAPQRSYSAHEL